MIEVKLIEGNDFVELMRLYSSMYQSIDPNINQFTSSKLLMLQINNGANFISIGLYIDSMLAGFVTGYEQKPGLFYFSGIYTEKNFSRHLKKLIDYAFEHIKEVGYTAWEADATNKNIASILEKYGAKPKHVRYHKEF